MIIEDINVYLNYFGEPAVYYEAAGTSHNIKAVFERINFEDGSGKQNSNLYATVKAADVPNLAKNKKLTRGSVDYYIINWEPDEVNDGIYKLELSKITKT
jgi:hypothetical protein